MFKRIFISLISGFATAMVLGGIVRSRTAAMQGEYSKTFLPYGAVPVEYIEADGNQYMNTGVYATEDTRVVATLMTISTGNKNWFGGSVTGSGRAAAGFCFNSYNSNYKEYLFGNSGWTYAVSRGIVGKVFDLDFSKDGIVIDGSIVSVPEYSTFPQQTAPIYLFVRYANSAWISGRVYSFRIYEGEELVRDYIPVKFPNESGEMEGGLYDDVTGVIFMNLGRKPFIIGPDKE